MPVKRSANRGKPKQTLPQWTQDESQRFVNEEAFSRFTSEVKGRKVHHEKGFLLSKKEHYGLPKEIADTIDFHQWSKFVAHPDNPIISLVREFYANILTPGQTFSMVRGLKISFSSTSVNMHFGLAEFKDDYASLVDKISGEELNKMLQELTVEGTTWLAEAENGPLKCSRSVLKPIPKVWYHIIRTHLLPTTHIETVSKDRLVLLHCILENKKINIGSLIEKEISVCAFKPK